MLKKIVVASVLSSVLGIACFESEGAILTPRLEDQVRGQGDPRAAVVVRNMRRAGRSRSIGNFEEFLRQHPEAAPNVANYVVRNTDPTGAAINGNGYARFVQEWTIPNTAIHQNPDGSFFIDPMALDSFRSQSIQDALNAVRGPQDPMDPRYCPSSR